MSCFLSYSPSPDPLYTTLKCKRLIFKKKINCYQAAPIIISHAVFTFSTKLHLMNWIFILKQKELRKTQFIIIIIIIS